MFNNITIGQYIPGDSWLHRLDPRIKILMLIIIIVATFLIPIPQNLEGNNIFPAIALAALLCINIVCVITARIPIGKVLKGLKGLVFLLTFTTIIQIFSITTGVLLLEQEMHFSISSIGAIVVLAVFYFWSKKYIKFKTIYFLLFVVAIFVLQAVLPYGPFGWYQMKIYSDGLLRSGFIFFRVMNIVIVSSILTFTTMTTDLNFGIESLLKPLKWIKLPVDTFAMLLTLTLRFIPTLLQETGKIMKAQTSRGVDFKESKIKDKIVQIISLLIPILVVSIKKAEDLADAMDVKGYVISAKRSRIDYFALSAKDFIYLSLSLIILSGIIVMKVVAL